MQPGAAHLRLKVRLHVGLLAAAVPEVEHEVAKEANVRVLDVLGVAEARRLTRNVVGKDDGAHRRLAGVALAHEQHLFPLRLHRGGVFFFSRLGALDRVRPRGPQAEREARKREEEQLAEIERKKLAEAHFQQEKLAAQKAAAAETQRRKDAQIREEERMRKTEELNKEREAYIAEQQRLAGRSVRQRIWSLAALYGTCN